VVGGILNSQWLNLKSQSLLEHFGLGREPFKITPDPSFLYLSPSHQQALARILYGIDARKGFVVLTGEVGTGKTTLIHTLVKELEKRQSQTTLIFNAISQSKELLRDVCEDLGFSAFQENRHNIHTYLRLLNQLLIESYRKGKSVNLIIDEAQTLSPRVLESIRLMSNFETSEDKLLQIVMAGQPELAVRLNLPSLRQLKQRVVLYHHLKPLNFAECAEYISHRIEIAGGNPSIFSPDALEAVYSCSGGIPRLINILCDNGMLAAYCLGEKAVSSAMIREVAEDRSLSSAAEEAARAKRSGIFARKRPEMRMEEADRSENPVVNVDEQVESPAESPVPFLEGDGDRLTALIDRLQRQREVRIFVDDPSETASDAMASIGTSLQSSEESHEAFHGTILELADSPMDPSVEAQTQAQHLSEPASEGPTATDIQESIPTDPRAAADTSEAHDQIPQSQQAVDHEDVLSIDFLEEMIGSLTEAMGPMAQLVVWDQVSALGEQFDAFPKSRLTELVESASREILEEPLRIRFQQIMSAGTKE
jgi:general secretion pathway protein A